MPLSPTETQFFAVLIAVIVGLVYASVLYLWQPKNFKFLTKWVLFTLRTLMIAVVTFVLIGKALNIREINKVLPRVLFVLDDSRSVGSLDSIDEFVGKEVLPNLSALEDRIQFEYLSLNDELTVLSEGDTSHVGYTDLSVPLNYLQRDQDAVAMILLTDGIFNRGIDPLSMARKGLKAPVYIIGVGDTSRQKDVRVKHALANSMVYLGNAFQLNVGIAAEDFGTQNVKVSTTYEGKLVDQRELSIGSNAYYEEFNVELQASKPGVNTISVRIEPLEGESNVANNERYLTVEVLDSKKSVEIWAGSTHPDIGTWRTLLERNQKYDVSVLREGFKVNEQDLVVLFDWFQTVEQKELFEALRSSGVSVLVQMTSEFNSTIFNSSNPELKFERLGNATDNVVAIENKGFKKFVLADGVLEAMEKWPPLVRPFGEFNRFNKSDAVLFQGVGRTSTEQPLLLAMEDGSGRWGVLAGSGIWRWKLHDHKENQEHANLGELLSQLVQYLTVKNDHERFRLFSSKYVWGKGEKITVRAELFDEAYELVTGSEVNVDLVDSEGVVTSRVMDAKGTYYELNLIGMKAGIYNISARTDSDLEDQIRLTVLDYDLEDVDRTARYSEMRSVALGSGGKFYKASELDQLVQELTTNPKLKPQLIEEQNWRQLIELRSLFWICLLLISVEWFIRKLIKGY